MPVLASRLLTLSTVLLASLSLTSCNLLGGLIGMAFQAAQVKLLFRCVPEGVAVDTPDGPRTIESLHVGDRVIGYSGEEVRVLQKHEYLEADAAERFLRVRFEGDTEVRVCDMHRIGGRRSMNLRPGSSIDGHIVTDITRYGGVAVSYDLLTEDAGYRIGGIPVNSMIEEMSAAINRRAGATNDWNGR